MAAGKRYFDEGAEVVDVLLLGGDEFEDHVLALLLIGREGGQERLVLHRAHERPHAAVFVVVPVRT